MASNRRDKTGTDRANPKSGPPKAAGRAFSTVRPESLIVAASIAGVLLAILIALGPLTPVLLAAPAVPFYYRAMKAGARVAAFKLAVRWSLTVFVTVALVAGFVSGRTERAVPLAARTQTAIQNWIGTADASPPADYLQLIGSLVIFAAVALLTGGAGGFVVGALGLASSACGAAYLFQRGDNLFHVLIIAVPPWLVCLFAACLFLLVPISSPFFSRLFGRPERTDGLDLRRYVYLGVGLLLGSLLLRLAVAGIWEGLTQRWTVP